MYLDVTIQHEQLIKNALLLSFAWKSRYKRCKNLYFITIQTK